MCERRKDMKGPGNDPLERSPSGRGDNGEVKFEDSTEIPGYLVALTWVLTWPKQHQLPMGKKTSANSARNHKKNVESKGENESTQGLGRECFRRANGKQAETTTDHVIRQYVDMANGQGRKECRGQPPVMRGTSGSEEDRSLWGADRILGSRREPEEFGSWTCILSTEGVVRSVDFGRSHSSGVIVTEGDCRWDRSKLKWRGEMGRG